MARAKEKGILGFKNNGDLYNAEIVMDKEQYIVKGFEASSAAAGLKKTGEHDVALIVSRGPAVVAGVFTTNKVKAAPVLLTADNIQDGKARAIIANSGNANACTGDQGLQNARRTAELVARGLNMEPGDVLVASTGVIGAQLDMEGIADVVPGLIEKLAPTGMEDAAGAIMTTDSFPKISRFEGQARGKPYSILGIAKGAGMIMPQMATMLCFVMSDIHIESNDLKEAVVGSAEATFNRISVDGDTSTNDMVLVMANGLAGNDAPDAGELRDFARGLGRVMEDLATMIVKDGEGATKVVQVKIRGAATPRDAETAARVVANSSLVKTAFYGQDPNWGRIMGALGRSGIEMVEEKVGIWINDIQIVANGLGTGTDSEHRAAQQMKEESFDLVIDLQQGDHADRVITCDLTHEYVSINADYRS